MTNLSNTRFLGRLTERSRSSYGVFWCQVVATLEGECSHEARAHLRSLFESMQKELALSASYLAGTVPTRSLINAFLSDLLASVPTERALQFCLPEFLAPHHRYGLDTWSSQEVHIEDGRLLIGGYMVMADWQLPLMKRCVDLIMHEISVTRPRVLELGWGLGVSASLLLERDLKVYTVVEAHAEVAEQARTQLQRHKSARVIHSLWQDAHFEKDSFDLIFFDSYHTTYSGSSLFDDLLERYYPCLSPEGVLFPFFGGPQSRELVTAFVGRFPFDRIVLSLIGGIKAPADWWNVEQGYLASIFIK